MRRSSTRLFYARAAGAAGGKATSDAGYFADATGFPAFFQPTMPSGITNTCLYPSFAASRADAWLAVHFGL